MARAIPPEADFNPPQPGQDDALAIEEVDSTSVDILRETTRWLMKSKLLRASVPLHYATIILSDADCVKFYANMTKAGVSLQQWTSEDPFRNSILHIAALQLKAKSVQWIMKNINWQKSLVGRKNNVGYTPLEDLESTLELMRTTDERGVRVSCKDAKFRGFPEEAIACLTLLREGKLRLSRIEKLRLKYGYTCGNCIRGFLSLRMKTALVHEAHDVPLYIKRRWLYCEGARWRLPHAQYYNGSSS
jgi:hypothetical protein